MSGISIDHVVINTRYELDAAADQFAAQGLGLTDQGHHSLGSINHLAMFSADYLELIGLPAPVGGEPVQRAGVSDAPSGINGLVFKTDDADQTFSHLADVNMQGDRPNAFSRPVLADGKQQQARFRTVHVRRNLFAAGRLYFCQHLTPELVWQPQWQQHANGATRIAEVVLVSASPEATAATLSALINRPVQRGDGIVQLALDGALLSIDSPSRFADRYGPLAMNKSARPEFFGALVVQCAGDQLAGPLADIPVIEAAGHRVRRTARGLAVYNTQFDALIEYVPAGATEPVPGYHPASGR